VTKARNPRDTELRIVTGFVTLGTDGTGAVHNQKSVAALRRPNFSVTKLASFFENLFSI
jgi:hypothetical protein